MSLAEDLAQITGASIETINEEIERFEAAPISTWKDVQDHARSGVQHERVLIRFYIGLYCRGYGDALRDIAEDLEETLEDQRAGRTIVVVLSR